VRDKEDMSIDEEKKIVEETTNNVEPPRSIEFVSTCNGSNRTVTFVLDSTLLEKIGDKAKIVIKDFDLLASEDITNDEVISHGTDSAIGNMDDMGSTDEISAENDSTSVLMTNEPINDNSATLNIYLQKDLSSATNDIAVSEEDGAQCGDGAVDGEKDVYQEFLKQQRLINLESTHTKSELDSKPPTSPRKNNQMLTTNLHLNGFIINFGVYSKEDQNKPKYANIIWDRASKV